jgi:hypothetical protein
VPPAQQRPLRFRRSGVKVSALAREETAGDSVPATTVLFGRYMLPNRAEFPCRVDDLGPGGALFLSSGDGEVGDVIVSYIDEIGRIEARILAKQGEGFRVEFVLSEARREKLAAKLQSLLQRRRSGLPEQRRHPRFMPEDSKSSLTLPDGRVYPCEVVDISVSGAAIKTTVVPSIGTYVMLGRMRGRITRMLSFGIAIEFVRLLDGRALDDHIG